MSESAPVAQVASAGVPAAPTDCLPAGLRSVLKKVEARFGAVKLVSTTELHTDNHSRGSVRHELHGACQAVDFKVKGNRQAVVAYLRSYPEVAGISSYGNNGVIHIDHTEPRQIAQR
ncbi:D-Ala-D-Ala carboxypeptidase family metallohydrolase [Microvirga arabica]|uniref:D-Ala-D-Ala carboxypeptidase family metallohydrolase n=1 Tax=Microvirga arabica TaxID=1128671 RepID=A0ABV6YA56_9HYPH